MSVEPSTFFLVYGGIWLIIGLGVLLTSIFWLVELVDVMRREFADTNTKLIWVLVILLGHFVGSVVYYFVGRQQGTLPIGSVRPY